jgi:hypothetical protein
MVWEDFGEVDENGSRMKLAVNGRNRVIAFLEDDVGAEFTVEVFLSLQDLGRKHPDWLQRMTLLSENERILSAYEKLLKNTRTAATK